MLRRTMRIEIGSKLYKSLTNSIERQSPWALEGKTWRVAGASRIEQTNKIRVELEEFKI